MKNELMGFYTTLGVIAAALLLGLELMSRNHRVIYRLTLWLRPWIRPGYTTRSLSLSSHPGAEPSLVRIMIYKKQVIRQLSRIKATISVLAGMCLAAILIIMVHIHWIQY